MVDSARGNHAWHTNASFEDTHDHDAEYGTQTESDDPGTQGQGHGQGPHAPFSQLAEARLAEQNAPIPVVIHDYTCPCLASAVCLPASSESCDLAIKIFDFSDARILPAGQLGACDETGIRSLLMMFSDELQLVSGVDAREV